MIIKDSVVHQDNTFTLTDIGAVSSDGKFVVCGLTTSNSQQIDGVELPHPFSSGWYTYDGSVFECTSHGLDDYKRYLVNELNKIARVVEEGGIVLEGSNVSTTRYSQTRLTGMTTAVGLDPTRVIDYKTYDGTWAVLNATQVESMATGVADHVQDCFTNEKSIHDTIDECTNLIQLQSVDMTTGWPETIPVETP